MLHSFFDEVRDHLVYVVGVFERLSSFFGQFLGGFQPLHRRLRDLRLQPVLPFGPVRDLFRQPDHVLLAEQAFHSNMDAKFMQQNAKFLTFVDVVSKHVDLALVDKRLRCLADLHSVLDEFRKVLRRLDDGYKLVELVR